MGKEINNDVGSRGEKLACKYLKRNKYKILETNYHNAIGEIDIIAKYKDILVFVEVKTRTDDYFGSPREAVDIRKQSKIRRVALAYLKYHKAVDSLVRFDVIEVLDDKINHLEDCF